MKQFFCALFTLAILNCVNGQTKIEITAGANSKVTVTNDPALGTGNNKIIITNEFDDNKCMVSFRNANSFFIFGKGGEVPLKKGETTFTFDAAGTVTDYPVTQQKISFPFTLKIFGNSNNQLLSQQVAQAVATTGTTTTTTTTAVNGVTRNNNSGEIIELPGLAQIPYYDALLLRNYTKLDRNTYIEILNYYLFRDDYLTSPAALIQAYANNPFLLPEIKKAFGDSAWNPTGLISQNPDRGGSLLSSVGGLDVTNFADGLAKFLVARFKEELSITFFEKFKDEMEKDKYRVLRTLFPDTYAVLKVIDKDIYQFNAYLNTIREAFIKDMANLYENFRDVTELPEYQTFLQAHKELATLISNIFYFIDQYAGGAHPGQVLADYEPELLINFDDAVLESNVRNSIKTVQLFSKSLRSGATDYYWVRADSVRALLRDNSTRDIYFGLVFQQASHANIQFQGSGGSSTRLDSLLAKAKRVDNTIAQFRNKINIILNHASEIDAYISDLKEKAKAEIDHNDYYKLFGTAIDLLEDGLNIIDLPLVNLGDSVEGKIKREATRWLFVLRSGADLYVDIKAKNYSSAIMNIIAIGDSTFPDFAGSKLRSGILKYGTFMANVATAKNSDEVKVAIEAIALPAGSASIKKKTTFNIALNAYMGGFWGNEYLADKSAEKWSPTTGMNAPVGITFSIPANFPFKESSWSAFITLIDIGALTSFRLQDDKTEKLPKTTLQNIFAPGLGLVYGVPKWPISIGYTFQFGPALREINPTSTTVSEQLNKRWQFFLAVDIPIVNFYTKSR